MSDDTIYRAAAIDAVKKYFKEMIKLNPEILVDSLITLPPAQSEPQWIPCNKKPPDKPGVYLVTMDDGVWTAHWAGSVGGWIAYDQEKILAWMDRPAPYRPEGEKE